MKHSPHLFLLILSVSVGVGSTRMTIVKSSPEKSTMVPEGETLVMTCEGDLPWFLCVWTSPQGGKQCAIQEGEATTSVCQGDPRVQLEGGPTSCTVRVFGVQREDRGNWMCLLQDGENFQTDRKLLEVEVATEGELEVMVGDNQVSEEVVRFKEEDEIELECRVHKAFPRPTITWSGLEVDKRVGREVAREEEDMARMQVVEEVVYDEVDGTFSCTSTLHYKARLDDTNSSLVCSMLQTDKQGILLYRQETSLLLDVVPLPPPITTASSTSLSGLILGSSVGVLFVLLLVFLLAFVLCRVRRQKQKDPPAHPSPPPNNQQPSVWTSNCSTNWTCQQREMASTESFEATNSITSNSSSSFQTNRSLGDLPTLTTLHGMRPPSSPLGLHHQILSCRSPLPPSFFNFFGKNITTHEYD